jgi:GDP-mannose transporter
MEKQKQDDDYRVDMGGVDRQDEPFIIPKRPQSTSKPAAPSSSSPVFPILSYCAASILMTVTNKYCLNGRDFNLNFFLLMVQVSETESLG